MVTSTITDADSDGVVVQKYRATIKQLLQYGEQLELALSQYGIVSDEFEQLKEEINRLYPEGIVR